MLFLNYLSVKRRVGCCLIFALAMIGGLNRAFAEDKIAQSQLNDLASNSTWLKLVHYEEDRASPTGWRSAIHTNGFFIDPVAGPTDPVAELRATIDSMLLQSGPAADDHAQCRFPARVLWLKRMLGPSLDLPDIRCNRWLAWRQGIDSVSLVLASGFLGNPASYYGHTFLKFNAHSGPRHTGLQDLTVSYGVIDDGHDNPLIYIVKGIFGGYDGGFSDIDYYFHRNQYGEIELRDLWEYELNLSQGEVDFVVAHAWEVLNQRYQYLFFRRNCAYRMAEIVQIVDGVNMIPPNRPWTIPQATVQEAGRQFRPDGRPLVKAVRYFPSRQTRFYASFNSLNSKEAKAFFELVEGPEALKGAVYQGLPVDRRRAVLDAVLDYQQFITDVKDRNSGRFSPVYAAALAERYALPPGPKLAEPKEPQAPHLGRTPGWIQLGMTSQGTNGSAALLRVRAAYYDPLDSEEGHVPFSGLTMGDLRLKVTNRRVAIDQLDLLSINSANPGITGLRGDRGQIWQIKVGAEQLKPGCKDCLVARAQGDVGIGRRVGYGLFVAAKVGIALQSNLLDQGPGFGRLAAGFIWRPTREWGGQLDLERRRPVGTKSPSYFVARSEWRHAFDKSYDFRLTLERSTGRDSGHRVSVGIGTYW